MLGDFLRDLRYGVRSLRRSPAFAVMVVLSLGVGIGANAAVFRLVNAVFLRPLPVRDPDGLVLFSDGASPGLSTVLTAGRLDLFSYPLYLSLRAEEGIFDGLAAQESGTTTALVRWTGPVEPGSVDHAVGRSVSANYFSVLGVGAHRGRTFLPDDEHGASAQPVMVLSHGYWSRRFGADPQIIGATVTMDGRPITVVGVAPPDFTGTEVGRATDFWVPLLANPPAFLASPKHRWLYLIARARPGTSMAAAQARVNVILQQFLAQNEADTWFLARQQARRQAVHITLERGATGMSMIRQRFRDPLLALAAGVGLLLLIVCLNVSYLLLARALGRQREVAIRIALGAGRGRLLRQLFAEGLILSATGAAVAGLATHWLTEGLLSRASSGPWQLNVDVPLDARVLGFTAALTLATTLLFGLVPAWRAWTDLRGKLAATSHLLTTGSSRMLTTRLLLASQVAFSLTLLFGAGLLAGSLGRLRGVPKGFNEEHLLVLELNSSLTGLDKEKSLVLYDEILRRVSQLPGVRMASLSTTTPLSGHGMFRRILLRENVASAGSEEGLEVGWNAGIVTPGYFETLGMPMVRGRALSREDGANAPRVAVVNEAVVRKFFEGVGALGKRFRFGGDPPERPDIEVVGIVGDAKSRTLREPPQPTVYVPVSQTPFLLQSLQVRTQEDLGDVGSLAEQINRQVRDAHPDLIVQGVRTMRDQRERSLVPERLLVTLWGTFGLAALLLVSLGLYGVMSQWVARRTREIGVRMALGATTSGVRWLIVRQALGIVLAGMAAGIPAAALSARLLKVFLYGVTPMDSSTLGMVASTLLAVSALAAYLPARRASRIDPMAALRCE
jgi:putative ABC transport system permease protein